MSAAPQELDILKARLKATWSAGDYGVVADNLAISADEFLSRIKIERGSHVLDVACGTGQVAFIAHAAGASRIAGIDIAPNLIAQAQQRAKAKNIAVQFEVGDAEDLPYNNGEFDLVVSLIGAMFASRPDVAASELLRVCKSAGRIVMGNWTAEGFIGKMFQVVSKYVAPPPHMESPLKWGDEEIVRARLTHGASNIKTTKRMYGFHYPFSPHDVVTFYQKYFGPIHKAFSVLDEYEQRLLHEDLENLWTVHNTGGSNETVVKAEILEVIAFRD